MKPTVTSMKLSLYPNGRVVRPLFFVLESNLAIHFPLCSALIPLIS